MDDHAQRLRQALIRNIDEALADPAVSESFERPPLYAGRGAALARGTAARQLGCSVDVVPPGQQTCPYHLHHAQEEMFIVLEGSGTLRVAGERLPIKAGDVMFLPAGPEYPHHLINTSDAPLKYLSISTRQYPELCEYPDSKKTMAWTPTTRVVQRHGEALDYWDGEP